MSDVANLLAEGKGDRAIANALGVTRHQARNLIREHERSAPATALALTEPRTATEFAQRITACWRQSVESILEVGRLLKKAKAALAHGEFGKMIDSELPFTASTAQRLMVIADDPKLANPAHVQHLPPSWGTLYELTKLPEEAFERGIREKIIRPDMERREAINGARSIMGSRQEPDDSLDYFPTPPWATRALMERVFPAFWAGSKPLREHTVWEPACGDGHMAEVLAEYFEHVSATDIHDYGYGQIEDFLNIDFISYIPDWIITNPPFGDKAIQFVIRSLQLASIGVAMFFRSQWAVEGIERYEQIFRDKPPSLCAFFVERVNLCKGRWEPDGTTATAYCWLVWVQGMKSLPPLWIPPGCREALTKPDDRERFTAHPVIKQK